jgi:hypothetical protein
MNMVDIIKKIRYMQVMLNITTLNSESRKFKLAHTFQNVIDLDEQEFMQPKQNKNEFEEMDSNTPMRDQVDENLEHQILNRGVKVMSNDPQNDYMDPQE